MTALTPTPTLSDVPQLETNTIALGGTGNPMNQQAQALLNRDAYRAQQISELPTSEDLENFTDPMLGAAILGRSTVSVDSMHSLLGAKKDGSQTIFMQSFHMGWAVTTAPVVGSGYWAWEQDRAKSNHNGGTVVSPTVPWDGSPSTLSAFLLGTGESNPGGTGCFVRLNNPSVIDASCFGALTSIDSWAPIQSAINAHGKVLLTSRFGGSKALVLRQLQELHGIGKESSGYYNTVCAVESLGSVLAPETGGLFSDNYNVSADLIIMAPSDGYSIYNHVTNMFIGNYGPSRSPRPQYNIFAPRVTNAEFKGLRVESASVAGYFTAITFSSIFERVNIINRSATYCWQFGYDGVSANAPVSMTSNTFNSCGANGSLVSSRWYVRNGTYSTFNACFADGASDTSNAWTFVDPNGLTVNACGSENVGAVSIKVTSSATLQGRKSITFIGYTDTVGGNWSGNACEVSGMVDVKFINSSILGNVSPLIKTTNSCRVEISGNIGFYGSSSDSTEPVSIDKIVYKRKTNATSFSIDDGSIFASGLSRFRIKPTVTATISARNNTGSAAKLYSGITKNGTLSGALMLSTIGASEFGSVTNQTSSDLSAGDSLGIYQNVAGFDFPEGGVSMAIDCNVARASS